MKIGWKNKTKQSQGLWDLTKELVFESLKSQKEKKKGKVGKELQEIMVEIFTNFDKS